MRDKSQLRNTLLVGQVLMLALYPVSSAHAQAAPVGAGFPIDAGDLRFIFHQIEVAQFHAAGGALLGPGPNQVNLNGVPDPQQPVGLRTVDGTMNNLVKTPDQHLFGSADRLFPRLTTPRFRPAEQGTSYATKTDTNVFDSQPRIISNLIVDQSAENPAAFAAAANPCAVGGFVCSDPTPPDPDSKALFIPNITPDFGLSAPFNLMFTFFGQFFDHGLDLVTKGGSGTVIIPLQPDDPLFAINMSVWTDLDALAGFVYRSAHRDIMRRRREWFAPMEVFMTLWWVPAGHQPTPAEGLGRLDVFERLGPTADAFSFRYPFPAPDAASIDPILDECA